MDTIKFEWDENKRQSNLTKHGLSVKDRDVKSKQYFSKRDERFSEPRKASPVFHPMVEPACATRLRMNSRSTVLPTWKPYSPTFSKP